MYKLIPKTLEDKVMFEADDYDSFETLFDKLTTYASTKHSLKLGDKPLGSKKDPNAMDVDAMDGMKGTGKGKGSGLKCWNCGGPHKARHSSLHPVRHRIALLAGALERSGKRRTPATAPPSRQVHSRLARSERENAPLVSCVFLSFFDQNLPR